MPDAQPQTPDIGTPNFGGTPQFNVTTPPPPQANPTQNPTQSLQSPLQQGLGLPPSFGSDVKTLTGMMSGAPMSAYQKLAQAEGDVLKAQQQQKIQQAQAEDQAYSTYGSSAKEALQNYQEEMGNNPLPTFVPTKETASDIGMLGGLLAIVGFMVGKGKGMQPGLAALDSMTGMLKGWQQGRQELYDKQLTTFKVNFERLREAHEEYARQLQNALEVSKVNLTKGLADAALAAAQAGDPIVAAQAKAGNLKAVIDAMNGQQGAMASAMKIIADLDSKQLARMEQMGTPQSQADIANAIATYKMQLPSGFALRSPFWQGVMAQVYQINPQYSAVNYNKINKAVSAFAVGKQGDTVRSLNVAAYHLQTFREMAAALGNNDVRLFNQIGQEYNRQTGLPAPTSFAAVKQIISNEVLKATGGSIGGVTDRKDLQDDLDKSNSPQQLMDVADKLTALIAGQFKGFKRQYESAVDTKDTGMTFENSGLIDPSIEKIYSSFSGGGNVPELTEQQYNSAPSGTLYRVPGNPTIMVKP